MNKEKLKEILYYLYNSKDGYTQTMDEYLKISEIIEALLEDTRNLCKCGQELKIGTSHHCNYLDGIPMKIEDKPNED